MIKRLICIVLVLSFLFCIFSCSAATDPGTEDTSIVPADDTSDEVSDTSAPEIVYEEDDLPEGLDLGGKKVVILSQGLNWKVNEICTDELNSEVVNDSIYNRERFVEDRLQVEIDNVKTTDMGDEIQKQVSSGEDTFQLYAYSTVGFSKYVFDRILLDLYTLDNINLSKPWWSSKFNAEAEIDNELYFTTGSLSLTLMQYLFAVYYNKELVKDYEQKYPDLSRLYDIVNEGGWTIDKLISLSQDIYTDLNGNSEKDEEDLYGMGFQNGISIDSIWSSFDIDVLVPDGDGWFELSVNTDKLFTALEKIADFIWASEGCFRAGDADENLDDLAKKFADGTLLFMCNKMAEIESPIIRNMQDDYGILPFPKYDENQKEYYSYAHDQYTSFGIPITNENPSDAAAVLEAMASYSYRETVPAYLDIALKGKYMSDAQSRKMIDLVVDGFKVDSAWIYLGTIGSGYPASFRYLVGRNDRTFSSTHSSDSQGVKRKLKAYRMMWDNKLN